jgi:iron(III) transport system ATP-binding protein
LREARATAIFVTHDQDEALSMADEVAVMWQGRIVQRATPQELYRKPTSRDVAGFLGEANFLGGDAHDGVVETELGTLLTADKLSGPAEVIILPEAIRLFLDGSSQGRVTDTEFYGHDRMFWVELPNGVRLKSRVTGNSSIRLGDHVRIQVEGPVGGFSLADL